jgi:hypothetical protein
LMEKPFCIHSSHLALKRQHFTDLLRDPHDSIYSLRCIINGGNIRSSWWIV